RLRRLGIERELEHVVRVDKLRRAGARQQIALGIARMAQADMPEGIEHALVGEHTARERKLIAGIVEGIGHGFSPRVLNAAFKPWRQYARRHAIWQARPDDGGYKLAGFGFAKMLVRTSKLARGRSQTID